MHSATPLDGARLESRLDHSYARADNGSDIEPHLELPCGSELCEPYRRQSTKASLLLPTDGTFGTTELVARSRLDFAEHESRRSANDEVDLAGLAAPIASDQRVTVLRVPAQRFVFTEATTRLRGSCLF